MDLITSAGSKLYIGTTTEFTTATGYASDTWKEVEEVEDLGDVGDEAEIITFTSLGDSRVRKSKGAYDAGTQAVVVGWDPTATGQSNMETAAAASSAYNVKIERDDSLTASGHGTIMYYRAKVSSQRKNLGQQNNVQRVQFNLAIDSAIIEDAAT